MESAPASEEGIAGRPQGPLGRIAAASWFPAESTLRRLAIATEVVLVATYVVLRAADAATPLLLAWTVAAAVVALVAPVSGLVVLAAVGPFSDPLFDRSALRSIPVLVFAVAAGVFVRELLDRREAVRTWLTPPVLFAGALLVATALGVVETYVRFGSANGVAAAQQWLFRIGAALVIFGSAYWAARKGSLRPLAVVLASTVLAGVVSLVAFVFPDLPSGPALDWLLAPTRNRLAGVIPVATGGASNALAVLALVPAVILAAAVIFGRDPRLRAVAVLLAVPLLLTAYLTYSRSALLALVAVALIYAWRISARLALVLLIVGALVAAIALPVYLQSRGQQLGSGATAAPGQSLIRSDSRRLRAWTAAGRMFVASPVIGNGYRSWPRLRRTYGARTLPNAHNELLMFFAEGGLVSGGLCLGFVLTGARALARRREWLFTGILGALVVYCVAASFNGLLGFLQLSVVLFSVVGAGVALSAGRAGPGPPLGHPAIEREAVAGP